MSWFSDLRAAAEHASRLASSNEYFAKTALRIRPKSGGLVPLIYNDAQRKLNSLLDAQLASKGMVRAIVVKGRQFGISTAIAGRYLKKTIQTPGIRCIVVAHTKPASGNLLKMIKRYIEHMPDDLKPSVGTSNSEEIIFDKTDSGYAIAVATEEGAGRSDTAQLLHGSECSRWPDMQEQLSALFQTVPRVPGSEIILESTSANYGDAWHQMWNAAEAGESEFQPIFLSWANHEEYQETPPSDWEPDAESRELAAQYGLTPAQLYWRKLKIAELRSDVLFRVEYPLSALESFQATSTFDSFIPNDDVARARKCTDNLAYGDLILGVDIGRTHDATCIARRRGRQILSVERHHIDDLMGVAGLVAKMIDDEKPAVAYLDSTGLGVGVVDRLHERGYHEVVPVNFSTRSTEAPVVNESGREQLQFANRRSQIYGHLLQALGGNFRLPDDERLHSELISVGYKHQSSGAVLLEEKALVKKRLGFSPDLADAVALCFAEGPPGARVGTSGAPKGFAKGYQIRYPEHGVA
jgi:hypothetical protein